jgi:hypothetical protein
MQVNSEINLTLTAEEASIIIDALRSSSYRSSVAKAKAFKAGADVEFRSLWALSQKQDALATRIWDIIP